MIQVNKVMDKFEKYIKEFDEANSLIRKKINHTYHVYDYASKLSKIMELNEEDTSIIKTIAILHDIGRFKQIEEKNIINDVVTKFDHAEYGCYYLFQENHIEDFEIDKKYYDIIKKAIYNHNKLEIETNLKKKELFFARLIRDLDKIDIFRVLAGDFHTFIDSPTKEVLDYFNKKQTMPLSIVKNPSDSCLYHLAYVFDIYFKESMELLRETDNLELYMSSIEIDKRKNKEFDCIKNTIRNYVEERIK